MDSIRKGHRWLHNSLCIHGWDSSLSHWGLWVIFCLKNPASNTNQIWTILRAIKAAAIKAASAGIVLRGSAKTSQKENKIITMYKCLLLLPILIRTVAKRENIFLGETPICSISIRNACAKSKVDALNGIAGTTYTADQPTWKPCRSSKERIFRVQGIEKYLSGKSRRAFLRHVASYLGMCVVCRYLISKILWITLTVPVWLWCCRFARASQ